MLQDVVTRSATLIETEIDGELVALDVDRGTCFGFNATASRAWALIAPSATVAAIVEALHAEFDVDRATCRAEVEALLRDFVERGLVTVGPPA